MITLKRSRQAYGSWWLVGVCALGLVVPTRLQAEGCDNEDDCEADNPCDCEDGGANPFSLFSGNVRRDIRDMELATQVGEVPMRFERTMTSRPEWTARPRSDYPFGQGGNWRHSFHWTILDDGVTAFGTPKIQVIDPQSRVAYYHKQTSSDMFMSYLPRTSGQVMQDGTNFFLYRGDGTKFHITGRTGPLCEEYRMEGFWDIYSNRYDFAYGTNGLLAEVRGPNTNHYFRFEYSEATNSVSPGVIRFSFTDNTATQAYLAGTFNGWSVGSLPMTLSNGQWIVDVSLTNGTYAYKFVARYSGNTNDFWYRDPDNSIYGGPDSNSVVVVDPFRLVSAVQASDGRRVSYRYGWSYNTGTNAGYSLDVLLVGADYEDGTSASYTYYPATYDQERKALPKTADDPHWPSGPGRAVFYTYRTNTPYSGKVYEEWSLTTTQLLGRLYNDPADSNLHVYVDSLSHTSHFGYHAETANLMAKTNALGYVTRREYADGWSAGDNKGRLAKSVDALGRTSVYTRTVNFGAVLTITNSASSCGCAADVANVYTDTNYPFYLQSRTERGGRTTTYTRDSNHRPLRIDYPDGSYVTNAYNGQGQVIARRLQDGSVWLYSYDDKGRKVSETSPLGYVTHWTYDARDRVASVSNALGYVTQYGYNWRGQVTNVIYADASEEKTWYDGYGSVTQGLSRSGGFTVMRYNDLGYLAQEVASAGGTNIYVRNAQGAVVTWTTPLGLTVSNTYDAIGRRIRETFSSDNTYNEWEYDPTGVRTQRNRLGVASYINYDAYGQITAVSDGNTNWTKFGYDDAGNRTHVTNALADVFVYTFDLMKRVTSVRSCGGVATSNRYDGLGRQVWQSDEVGIVTSNSYDLDGRLVATWCGGMPLVSNEYNAVGRPIRTWDSAGLVVSNAYDAVGRLIRSHMPDGTYSAMYYTNGFVAAQADRAGRRTYFSRDAAGRPTTVMDNGTNSVVYRYDFVGNMTNLVDQNGRTTKWRYDAEGRQVAKTYDDGSTDAFGYDAAGRLTTKTNAGVRGVQFTYDPAGNLTNVLYPTDPAVSFSYDAINRRTRMVDGVGTTTWTFASSCLPETSVDGPFANDSVTQGFDGARRLTNLVYAGLTVPYELDALGRIVTVGGDATNTLAWLGQSSLLLTNSRSSGTVTEYGRDALLRLTNVLHRLSSGSALQRFGLVHNDADERTRVTREDGHYRDYGYDPIGQLMSAQGYESGGAKRPGYGYAYAYDPAGNPLRQERNGFVTSNAFNYLNQNTTSRWSGAVAVAGTANLSNGTVTVNGVSAALRPAYDGGVLFAATNIAVSAGTNVLTAIHTDPFGRAATGRVTVVAQNAGYGFDRFGNLTNDGQFAYVWDDADRLKQVRSLASGMTLLQCRYDGIGRRVERVEQGVTNRYVYSGPSVCNGWLVLAVLSGSNTVRETYRHGPDLSGNLGGAGGIGSILSVSDAVAGMHAYHFDFNGNVTLTTAKTGAVAAVSSWIEYDPFGEVLAKSGSFEPNYRFSGKEWDASVGLSYFGFRYYSPLLGRWLSRDLIGEAARCSLYGFVFNSPTHYVDPHGMAAWSSGEIGSPWDWLGWYNDLRDWVYDKFGANWALTWHRFREDSPQGYPSFNDPPPLGECCKDGDTVGNVLASHREDTRERRDNHQWSELVKDVWGNPASVSYFRYESLIIDHYYRFQTFTYVCRHGRWTLFGRSGWQERIINRWTSEWLYQWNGRITAPPGYYPIDDPGSKA